MEFDDRTERNDTITRIIALGLFSTGLVIELAVITYYCGVHVHSLPANANNSTHFVELLELEMKSNNVKKSENVEEDEEEEEEEEDEKEEGNGNPLQLSTNRTYKSLNSSKNSSKFNYSVLNNQHTDAII